MTPPSPSVAAAVFGRQLPVAERYAQMLATTGIAHGLLGPREVDRLWERHLLNCAVVADLVEPGEAVIDVGSGAGLPGLAMAIARPDLQVTLVEPLQRRVSWLRTTIRELAISVEVRRSRAEDLHGAVSSAVVTARAVAPLATLASWVFPLLRPGGRLLAIKGKTAEAELLRAAGELRRMGASATAVVLCGDGVLEQPTRVTCVTRT